MPRVKIFDQRDARYRTIDGMETAINQWIEGEQITEIQGVSTATTQQGATGGFVTITVWYRSN